MFFYTEQNISFSDLYNYSTSSYKTYIILLTYEIYWNMNDIGLMLRTEYQIFKDIEKNKKYYFIIVLHTNIYSLR